MTIQGHLKHPHLRLQLFPNNFLIGSIHQIDQKNKPKILAQMEELTKNIKIDQTLTDSATHGGCKGRRQKKENTNRGKGIRKDIWIHWIPLES